MTTYAEDDFHRPDQAGFGNATTGQAWGVLIGSDTPAIVSNQGQVTSVASAFDTVILCGSQIIGDTFIQVQARIAAQNAGPVWKVQDNANYYRVVTQGGTIFLQKCVAFSFSNLVSETSLAGWNSTDYWNYLVQHSGNNIAVYAWKSTDPQPGSPTLTATDATFASGKFGITSVGNGSGSNFFSSFLVTDGQAPATNKQLLIGNHRAFAGMRG